MASGYFDSIVALHAGPNGRKSTDGTIETLERWGVRTVFTSIDDGFGAVRTKCLRESDTAFVMIMDADERFYPKAPILHCHGSEAYPQVQNPNVKVSHEGIYDQGQLLRQLIQTDIRAVKAVRRHWFAFGFHRPTQNWEHIPDYQLRIVKNDPDIYYKSEIRMHERIWDNKKGGEPHSASFDSVDPRGIFFEHFHCLYKSMEPEQRKEDIAIYDAIHSGTQQETWKKLGYI